MNTQQVLQSRSSNGYGRRKVERDTATRSDNKFLYGKTDFGRTTLGKGVAIGSSSRDRLIYLTTCLIGHLVEVQVMDGSVFSGIFHAANAEDFGFEIVLKMAHLIKDGSRGQNGMSKFSSKPPARTVIIQAKDLVQVIAKGLPLTRDGLANELQHDKQQELMTDTHISQSRYVEVGRELERWVPDKNDLGCPELENIFDSPWNRQWDQFEANATLFGVTSTFNEDLYTTKLEKGPQMRDLERKAERLAREIEGEETHDLHLAEERGIQLVGNLEIDEETRFSSVYRGADDSGYDDVEDILLDSRNDETFGDVSRSMDAKPLLPDRTSERASDEIHVSSQSSSRGEGPSSVIPIGNTDVYHSSSGDHGRHLVAEQFPKNSSVIDTSRVQDNQYLGPIDSTSNEDKEKQLALDQNQAYKAEANLTDASYKNQANVCSSNELSEDAVPSKTQGTASHVARPSSSASSNSDCGGIASTSAGRGLSSSSSVGSLLSEKSTLNPHAKEFKFNPNAKSFVPSHTPLRPSSPAADVSYYPANVPSVTQMHGMPMGIGIAPPFSAQQPFMFNPQASPMPQPYYHPNAPQYGQQMMIGQPRPVLYLPTYPTEMPYNGREF